MPGREAAWLEDNATVNTITFMASDAGTKLTLLTQCSSKEIRDMIVASGMETGMQTALDYLEQIAVSLIQEEL